MAVRRMHRTQIARGMERNDMDEREMEKFIIKTDKYRGDFYHYYTGRTWNDARNYDLCLDSSKLGFEKCVEAIKEYAKVRFGADVFDRSGFGFYSSFYIRY